MFSPADRKMMQEDDKLDEMKVVEIDVELDIYTSSKQKSD